MSLKSETNLLDRRPTKKQKYVIAIHGGAGIITKAGSTPEKIAAYHAALKAALLEGYNVLAAGGQSMDAAVAAVSSMEGEH
jgi:beta-aspartyl-peptidase (threonine type)